MLRAKLIFGTFPKIFFKIYRNFFAVPLAKYRLYKRPVFLFVENSVENVEKWHGGSHWFCTVLFLGEKPLQLFVELVGSL